MMFLTIEILVVTTLFMNKKCNGTIALFLLFSILTKKFLFITHCKTSFYKAHGQALKGF